MAAAGENSLMSFLKTGRKFFMNKLFPRPEPHSTIDSVTALHPPAPGSLLLMLLRLIDGTACDSGQRLENVNQTHLVLVSGKLVLQS